MFILVKHTHTACHQKVYEMHILLSYQLLTTSWWVMNNEMIEQITTKKQPNFHKRDDKNVDKYNNNDN